MLRVISFPLEPFSSSSDENFSPFSLLRFQPCFLSFEIHLQSLALQHFETSKNLLLSKALENERKNYKRHNASTLIIQWLCRRGYHVALKVQAPQNVFIINITGLDTLIIIIRFSCIFLCRRMDLLALAT